MHSCARFCVHQLPKCLVDELNLVTFSYQILEKKFSCRNIQQFLKMHFTVWHQFLSPRSVRAVLTCDLTSQIACQITSYCQQGHRLNWCDHFSNCLLLYRKVLDFTDQGAKPYSSIQPFPCPKKVTFVLLIGQGNDRWAGFSDW